MRFKINGIEKHIAHTPGQKVQAESYATLKKMAGFAPQLTVEITYQGYLVKRGQIVPVQEGVEFTIKKDGWSRSNTGLCK